MRAVLRKDLSWRSWGLGGWAVVLVCLAAPAVAGQPLAPAFPNYALVLPPSHGMQDRDGPSGPVQPGPPFGWNQTMVGWQNGTFERVINGYDPGLQLVQIVLAPEAPQYIRIEGFNDLTNFIQARALPGSAGQLQNLFFTVNARGLQSPALYTLTFDIRARPQGIRRAPTLGRSAGDIIAPGQIVSYTWTQTGQGKLPKVDALLQGCDGPALGINQSTLTAVLGIKVQPMVLGNYLLTVTPRDVLGEPPTGSTSNGGVFLCAFGSDPLPPVTDGFVSDNFMPAVGEDITLSPVAVDPQTGATTFSSYSYDFGDGSTLVTGAAPAVHSYNAPGIYRVSCTVPNAAGLQSTAEDNVVVGAVVIPQLRFQVHKEIIPQESGIGQLQRDKLTTVFENVSAAAGDQIVFCYNRNYFGRAVNAVTGADVGPITLGPGGTFSGTTPQAAYFDVAAANNTVTISMENAQFDRTGDPRLGRSEHSGIFQYQRIGLCVIPADGSTPRVQVYTGNMLVVVTGGGAVGGSHYWPEVSVSGAATIRQPNPRRQELVPPPLGPSFFSLPGQ